jgi:hypothetical protein
MGLFVNMFAGQGLKAVGIAARTGERSTVFDCRLFLTFLDFFLDLFYPMD